MRKKAGGSMKFMSKRLWLLLLLAVLVVFSPLAVDSADTGKRPLSHEDYDAWRGIREPIISNDGNWAAFLDTPQDGDAYLVVKHTQEETCYRHNVGYTGKGTKADKAVKASFSADSSYLVFLVSRGKEEAQKSKKEKKKKKEKAVKKLAILKLADGTVQTVDRVKSFKMPKDRAGWLVYSLEAPPKEKDKKDKKEEKTTTEKEKVKEEKKEEKVQDKKKDKKKKKKKFGTRLMLRALDTGKESAFESVLIYGITKNGRYLLFVVSHKKEPEKDGLYKVDINTGDCLPLLKGEGNYKHLNFNKEETHLAIMSDYDNYHEEKPIFKLYGCRLADSKASLWVSREKISNFPKGMAVSDKSDIKFSDDGKVVMFGIKEIPPVEPEDKEEKEEAKFDLWHWNDPYPQPQQKIMEEEVRNNTWESVYHVKTGRFLKLADEKLPDMKLHPSGKIAFANNPWPYAKSVAHYGDFFDVYVVDTRTGVRTRAKEKLLGEAKVSPGGNFLAWFDGKDWFLYDIKKKKTRNLTAKLDVSFHQEDWDMPMLPESYDLVGWTDNDSSLLVNDRFDIWEFKTNGTGSRMVTEGLGREKGISFRYIKLDKDKTSVDPHRAILLKAVDSKSLASGYYADSMKGDAPPKPLIFSDRRYEFKGKARYADRVVFTRQTFDEFPDLWTSELEFKSPRKISDLGKQMTPFIWGKQQIVDFASSDGKPLKGILIKPGNFDPKKKYPLMVYIYETLHTYMSHRFRHPAPGSSINPSYYVSNGYVLWMPDIEYGTGYPGKDALKCVLPGIQMLINKGFIDKKAIGIQGHSWGGYQISYMVTQTNIFAAAEAGAPVSNMTSAYNGIRWQSGMVRQFQYEHSQSRLGDTLWKVPLRYMDNSPIFWADKIQTPLMIMHNDEDGAVPWYQGIELIMALRRLEKEAYMFNYNGEKHGLRQRVNKLDWTRRLAEFFDHHLKGAPAPKWMTQGIKAWEKKKSGKK